MNQACRQGEDDAGSTVLDELCSSVTAFLNAAAELTPEQVAALLERDTRPVTRRALKLDPTFLRAVSDGSWDTPHDVAIRRAQESCRHIAGQLAGWRARRSLAAALEEAALAAIASTGPCPVLPADMLERLGAQWRNVVHVPTPRVSVEGLPQ